VKRPARRTNSWVLLLLLIPFIAVLWPPFYNSLTPSVLGLPMFIWYQFLWTILSALITILVYLVWRPREVVEE
jgi:hypothetical protein